MATAARSSGRSLHGCWTCRLRKKKCDETRPSCFNCTSLELSCNGYGPRPQWMDRGALERAQAVKVRDIVGQKKLKRQKQRLQSPRHRQGQELEPPAFGETPVSNVPSLNLTQDLGAMEDSNIFQGQGQLRLNEAGLSTCDDPIFGDSYHLFLPTETVFKEDLPAFDPCLFDTATPISDGDTELTSTAFGLLDTPVTSSFILLNPHETSRRGHSRSSQQPVAPEDDREIFDLFRRLQLETLNRPGYSLENFTSHIRLDSLDLPQKHTASSWPTGPTNSVTCEVMEDGLLMHYLDHVFYLQYPFYDGSDLKGRGWLFSIVRRAKSVYHAVLALSEYHYNMTHSRHKNIARGYFHLAAKDGHYDLALRETQRSLAQFYMWSEGTRLGRSIEALTSILHLIFWELFSCSRGSWQIHLSTAAILIPVLVQTQVGSTAQSGASSHNEPSERDIAVSTFKDGPAIKFLLGSFILMDIISCTSTRSSPLLDLDHKFLLERTDIPLKTIAGCSNWVLLLILEIARLDSWKKEADKAHRLSIMELTDRANQIKRLLGDKLAEIENKLLFENSLQHSSGIVSEHTKINKLYALSAITYLHVVVSGAHPELPEIRESVSRTIATFQTIKKAKLLRNLVWPFCITGCLAVEGQYATFRDLISAAEVTELSVGTCVDALKIMEECWETRKACSYNCDWASIMNKWGHPILLL